MNTPSLVEAALALAGQGIPSFPCSRTKAPTCPHGFKDATVDEIAVRDLWRRFPGQLIGIATGAASGLDALDIDSAKHPEAAAWLDTQMASLPPTRIHATGSGGRHLLFYHAPGLRSSTGRRDRGLGVPGLDVRADGGCLVWWPAVGLEVIQIGPVVAWPEWLLEGILRRPIAQQRPARPTPEAKITVTYAIAALRSAVIRVATAPYGCINDTLNRECWSLVRFVRQGQLNEQWVKDDLLVAARTAGETEPRALATISSALRSGGSV